MAGWVEEKATAKREPLPCKFAPYRPGRYANLSRMGPAAKQAAWRDIKTRRPDLAQLLKDPTFLALREAFDAEICVEVEALRGE